MKTYEEIVRDYKKRQHDTVVDTIATGLTYMDEIAVDTGLLEETGILTEGENVDKKNLPFKNTVYRKMKDAGVKVDGELVYRSDEGAVLFKDQIRLCLDGDFSLDMPQKGFLIDAA